jgi:two-component system response regulator MprA
VDAKNVESALILVVDDDVRTARLLVRLLRDDGFEVEMCTDGACAIARLGRHPLPSALITDLRMPHVDGMSVARYARSRSPQMPIFVTTGYPNLVDAAPMDAELTPPAFVHTKPIDYQRLAEELRHAAVLPVPSRRLHGD